MALNLFQPSAPPASLVDPARAELRLDQVDNTSDLDKPISTAVQAALDALAVGAAPAYVHTQAAPDTTWTINHNLGFIPSVELLTAGGVEFDAEVVHTSVNQTLVYLLTAMAGSARLN